MDLFPAPASPGPRALFFLRSQPGSSLIFPPSTRFLAVAMGDSQLHPGLENQLASVVSSKMPPMKAASHKGWLWMQKKERDDEGNLWEQSYFALVEKTLRMYRTDEEADSHLKDVRALTESCSRGFADFGAVCGVAAWRTEAAPQS